jgi:(p)ppGpp synthase/HD superfamily hydrolase
MTPVPLHERERGEKMGLRVTRTAAETGLSPDACGWIGRLHDTAMTVRNEALFDDHDSRYLHPGRSALILLQDVGETDAAVLGAAIIVDSQFPELMPDEASLRDLSAVEAHWVEAVLELRAEIPPSGDEMLAERLVTASGRAQRAALAERLDHLRHAHIDLDLAQRRRVHEEAEAVYLGIAQRTHAELERRYRWWCRMFASRHLR